MDRIRFIGQEVRRQRVQVAESTRSRLLAGPVASVDAFGRGRDANTGLRRFVKELVS